MPYPSTNGPISTFTVPKPAFLRDNEFYSVAATSVAGYMGLGGPCEILGFGNTLVRYSNPTATSTTGNIECGESPNYEYHGVIGSSKSRYKSY